MKINKCFLSVLLSFIIFLASVYNFTFISYASYGGGGGSNHGVLTSEEKKVIRQDILNDAMDGFVKYGSFIFTELGALSSHDFCGFLSNYLTYKDYVMNDWQIDIDDDGNITFSEDLVAYIKQALKEYNEENCGYKIVETVPIGAVQGSMCHNGYELMTLRKLVYEYGRVGFNTYQYRSQYKCQFADLSNFYKDKNEFVYSGNYIHAYNSLSYKELYLGYYSFNHGYDMDESYSSFDDIAADKYSTDNTTGSFYSERSCEYYSFSTLVKLGGFSLSLGNLGFQYVEPYYHFFIVTNTSERFRVFNSLAAMQNYTAGTRPVYFGSGFYEDPGDIKVSFDDFEKYLDGKYDSFFDDLKDALGENEDSMTEDEIEKIVDKLLDKLGEVGGKVDDTNSSLNDIESKVSESNNWLEKIYNRLGDMMDQIADGFKNSSAGQTLDGVIESISGLGEMLEEYLSAILLDLDYIVYEMQDMTEDEVTDKSGSMVSELSDAFLEVGDTMSKKFPFSIPWDIKNLYVTLNGGREPGVMSLAEDIGFYDTVPSSSGNLFDVDVYSGNAESGIMPLADSAYHDADGNMGGSSSAPLGGVTTSASGAPIFKIPLAIPSFEIDYFVVIDMSRFDALADISRTMFLLIFIYQLLLLSMKVFEFVRRLIE